MRSWVWIFPKLETYFQNVSGGETEGYCLLTLPSTQRLAALSQSASKIELVKKKNIMII